MLYAPHVPGGDRRCVRLARMLRHLVDRTDGWQLATTARRTDAAGKVLHWPQARFTPLVDRAKGGEKDKAYQNADVRDIMQLTEQGSAPFDALFLPYAWCTIPLGCKAPIPAPIVAAVPNLEFDYLDYGLTTDQFRRDLEKLVRMDADLVFASEATRRRAILEYAVPAERTHVVAPAAAATDDAPQIARIRSKYRLPERYVLCQDWLKPQENGLRLIEAMSQLAESIPLVSIGTGIDEFLGTPLEREPYAQACRQAAMRLGAAAESDIFERTDVSEEDLPAIIAGATAVALPAVAAGGLPSLALNALALGVPLAFGRIDAFVELLGDIDDVAVGCDPFSVADLKRSLETALTCDEVGRARTSAGRAFASRRSELDVARELLDLCGAAAQRRTRSFAAPTPQPMVPREQRVAWLINHTTLRDFEVPLLRSLGYEVYTSKLLPKGNDIISITVDYSEDENATLPVWVLRYLNGKNLYEDSFDPALTEVLNSYFGTVICTAVGPMVKELVRGYRGRIIVRVFGREHPRSYSEYLNAYGGARLWEGIWKIQHRFWFGQCYESIGTIEEKLLKDRCLTLPLGLPDRILRRRGDWTGVDNRILFVCSRIKASPTYYGKIYEEFKHYFGDLPHLIAGTQPTPVDDENVSGFAPDHTFRHWLREFRVMFYHSREPRHLHYHPLEAIVHGMPVIYMKGGLLDGYGGADQPGACDTLEAARKKIVRILDGDFDFIHAIQDRQQAILEEFLWEYNRRTWQARFSGVALAAPLAPDVPGLNAELGLCSTPANATDRPPATPPLHRRPQILHYGPPRDAADFVGTLVRELAHRPQSQDRCTVVMGCGATAANLGLDPRLADAQYLPVHATPTVVKSLASEAPMRVQWNSVESIIDAVTQSAPFQKSRIVRLGLKLAICGMLYARGAWRQKAIVPRATGMANFLPRRLLSIPGVQAAFEWNAARTARAIAAGWEQPAGVVYSRYLVDPPAVRPAPLPVHATVPPLDFPVLDALLEARPTLVPRPFGLLSPNQPIEQCQPRPVAVCIDDFDFDFNERHGSLNLSRAREFTLWTRIAERFIFPTEWARAEAVRRYGVPENRTQVIAWPALALSNSRGSSAPRRDLPSRYLLTFDGEAGDSCGLALVQALQLLRWRQTAAPPVVFVRRRYGGKESDAFYAFKDEFERAIANAKWVRGQDFHVVELASDDELPGLFANAALCVSTSRSGPALQRIVLDAFAYQTPALASCTVETAQLFGSDGQLLLLVDPDDPTSIADAIESTIDAPEAAQRRCALAYDVVHRRGWHRVVGEFAAMLDELARPNGENLQATPQPQPTARAA